jgi:hypothetical protein
MKVGAFAGTRVWGGRSAREAKLWRVFLHGGDVGAFDLVAEEGGALEFELGGGFCHLAFEFADDLGDGVFGAVFADDVRGDAVLGVVVDLELAAVAADGEQGLDALGLLVGEEDDFAGDVAGGAAGGLDERGLAAQEAFLVGIEDADEGDLGEVEAFAEEVDADEDVEVGGAEAGGGFRRARWRRCRCGGSGP